MVPWSPLIALISGPGVGGGDTLLAIAPGAVVDVDIEEDGEETVEVSATVRRAGKTARGVVALHVPLDGPGSIAAMNKVVRAVLEHGA